MCRIYGLANPFASSLLLLLFFFFFCFSKGQGISSLQKGIRFEIDEEKKNIPDEVAKRKKRNTGTEI